MPSPLAGRRCAVVGATGFIGSHLTECLVRSGAEVLAVAHTTCRLRHLAAVAEGCRFVLSDILERDSIATTVREFRPEVVFHLAADHDAGETFSHMTAALAANAVGTANVLDAAAGAGASLLVYADSCKVYGNGPVPYRSEQPEAPICSYAIGKAAGWRLCRLSSALTGLAVVSVRATCVYGPRQNANLVTHVRDCALASRPVRLLGGSQTRDLLYVDDAVAAFVTAATTPSAWGGIVPIGGGCELTVCEIARRVACAISSPIEIVSGQEPPRLTEIWRMHSDNAEARELLGWSPQVSLDEGLARTLR
jgi:UDP-glucose 4-epimerase